MTAHEEAPHEEVPSFPRMLCFPSSLYFDSLILLLNGYSVGHSGNATCAKV